MLKTLGLIVVRKTTLFDQRDREIHEEICEIGNYMLFKH
jgi:hypothetical protein